MSAIHIAKSYVSAFREKPHSSITDWVDVLTTSHYEDEVYDGIPELVDSINLQAAGPTEASRAIRKKLKHGDPHQQYRALVILNALVENGGHKFQTSFADGQLTDALRHLASDPSTDPRVKRKLMHVLASWHNQFKGDPSMSLVSNMYKQNRIETARRSPDTALLTAESEPDNRRKEEKIAKEEAKRKAKEAKAAERTKQKQPKSKRKPFDFEQQKPQILSTVAEASQATNNLVNAIMLVNIKNDSLQSNERVQECLTNVEQVRKQVVRYIQLVENEDVIGTLIEANERLIAAAESYNMLSKSTVSEQEVADVRKGLAAVNLHDSESKLQDKQRAVVTRNGGLGGKDRAVDEYGNLHSDLHDLDFGSLGGAVQSKLPPPLQPSAPWSDEGDDEFRGSLSDYSDYESSDEELHRRAVASSSAREGRLNEPENNTRIEEDPFADPFADNHRIDPNLLIDTASINDRKW